MWHGEYNILPSCHNGNLNILNLDHIAQPNLSQLLSQQNCFIESNRENACIARRDSTKNSFVESLRESDLQCIERCDQ